MVQWLGEKEIRSEYGYDELGRQIWQEDANDNRTKYEYDLAGRRTAVVLPSGQRSTTAYDGVGNVEATTDFNGETTSYEYDERNRLTFKDYEDDADVSYTYNANGQIESITDGRGTTTLGYDELGRLLWRKDPDGVTTDNGRTIEYEYDSAGNRTAVITPNGRIDYTYDEQNRIETVTDSNEGVTRYTYDAVGNLTRTDFPNHTFETRSYDESNRLISLSTRHRDPLTGEETLLSGYEYTLNDAGHRLSVTEHDGRVVNYTYDDLSRLVREDINNGERVISYTYDDVGNRLTREDSVEGTTSYTYSDNDLLLSETLTQNGETVQTVTYTYDDNGNLITRTQVSDGVSETTTYTWNDDNRLVGVETVDGRSIAYEYDDSGIRVSTTIDGETTDFLVDKNRPYAQVLEELSSDELVAFYVYGRDLISQQRNGESDFYVVDGLGSTRGLTDSEGNLTDTYDYDAFGELIGSSGQSENDFLFAGEQLDGETGDYYLRQRFYDGSTGRFTRRDSYEGDTFEPITLNKYVYGNANPVTYVDQSGLYGIAEANAAASIGNILNGIQLEYGSHLISATLSDGDYDAGDVLNATIIGLAAAGAFPLLRGLLNRFVRNGACFVAGTEIITPNKKKKIEDIKVGDLVIAYDPTSPGVIDKKKVVKTFERKVSEVIELYVDGEVITTTNEHPFWVPDKGWVKAKDLALGMSFLTYEQNCVDLDSIKLRQKPQKVYNFEVEDFHTYFVSSLGILVHNACYDLWNLTDHTVTVKHHNWDKVFSNKKISLPDVEPLVKDAIDKGEWKSIKVLRGKKGVVVGEGLILEADVNGHKIWVEGIQDQNGIIRVKNAGVK